MTPLIPGLLYAAGLLVSFALGFVTNIASDRYSKTSERSALLRPLGWLAYVRMGNVYIARADGSDERQLTRGGEAVGIAWSPEGGRLAIVVSTSAKEPRMGLWVADLRSATWEAWLRDVPGSAGYSRVVWAFRADSIAFDMEAVQDTGQSCVVRVRRIMEDNLPRYTSGFFNDCESPTLDAYGDLLSIRILAKDEGCVWQIVSAPSEDNYPSGKPIKYGVVHDIREPVFADTDVGYAFETVRLSPNGDRIAFVSRWNVPGLLWIGGSGSSPGPRMVPNMDRVVTEEWSPDGTRLLAWSEYCSSSYSGAPSADGVFIVDATTLECRPLVQNEPNATWFFHDQCWSCGGNWVLLQKGGDFSTSTMHLVHAASSEVVEVGLPPAAIAQLQPVAYSVHPINMLDLRP
ncbi:MAG: TolB-like translocation protein [Armatimonadota bacterium]